MATLTPEIIAMFGLLGLTILLFASDVVRVDIGALCILLLLALTTLVPGLEPLIDGDEVFSGFASNAVIAIIAVMILSAGLEKTGIVHSVASAIMRYGRQSERRLTALVCSTAGMTSSFMQNTGAAALYIPVTNRIAARSGLALNRLLLPMGFTAIAGGTLTMVGSSPLILLHDLLPRSIEPVHLFEVTPVGLALVAAAVLYFLLLGRFVLPEARPNNVPQTATAGYLRQTYGLSAEIFEARVPADSPLAGITIEHVELTHRVRIVAAQIREENRVAPAREAAIEPDSVIAVLGHPNSIQQLVEDYKLELRRELNVFAEPLTPARAGISEILIPPNSDLIGRTIGDVAIRKTFGLTILNIRRGENNFQHKLRDIALQAGDTLVCHSTWRNLARLLNNKNFVIITTEFPHEQLRPQKARYALGFLVLAIALVLFTGLPLSVSLMCGAMGMVLTGVLSMDEAYRSISWPTVFLLGSLIPVGLAVEQSGTADWIAQSTFAVFGDVPGWALLSLVGVLATFFSLTLSNVGATVLLVPLVVKIALAYGLDPRLFALTAAICASNAFILPTHQVNALIMGPGSYTVRDFMRAGTGMTVVYLVVALVILLGFY
jgi:di/tricarboxylate transporter